VLTALKHTGPVVLALSFLLACGHPPKTLDDAALRNARGGKSNWLMYGRTYEDQRFSSLDQINEQTVSRLGLAWSREMGTPRGLEATPLIKDGLLYTASSWDVVHAMNAKTGATLWTYDPKVPRGRALFYCCDVVNRGVALYCGKVFVQPRRPPDCPR
jgi:glucose dehydrogenase